MPSNAGSHHIERTLEKVVHDASWQSSGGEQPNKNMTNVSNLATLVSQADPAQAHDAHNGFQSSPVSSEKQKLRIVL